MTTLKQIPETDLRPATLDDVEPLAALSHRTILAKYGDVIGLDKVQAYVASGAVPAYYRDRNAFVTVAEIGGEVVGACAVKDATVDLMMVALERHRSGVGSALLADAERKLFAAHPRLSLESFRDNTQANRFYAKHGWTLAEHFHDAEHDIPMVRFVK